MKFCKCHSCGRMLFAAESPQTSSQDKVGDFGSAGKPVSNEIAKLVIIKKDGIEGPSMDIANDITIGRFDKRIVES